MGHKIAVKNKKLLLAAIQQIDVAVFITNTSGEILYVNNAFENITGYTSDEAIGQTPHIINSGEHEPQFFANLWDTIMAGKIFRGTVINKRKNGEIFYTDHTITPIKNKEDEIEYFVASWKDITERIKEQEMRSELINLVSHELKTPITTIKTLTQLLNKRAVREDNDTDIKFYKSMDQQISKLVNFINDLLDITNIEGGKLKFHFEEVDFDTVTNTAVEESRIYLDNRDIIVKGKTNSKVKVDVHRLEQVVNNLLTNACKFSPPQEVIIIRRKLKDNKVVFSVTDKGVGIPQKEISKIFSRYYRVRSKENRSIPGVGLGLYITSEIVKRHGGDLWVESEPGQGSTFFFTLPISEHG